MEKILVILDSIEYKRKEVELKELLSEYCDPIFFYSKYENKLTEKFQKTKYVGGLLTHIAYWIMSFGYAIKLYFKYDIKHVIFINPIVGIFFAGISRLLLGDRNITVAGFLFEDKSSMFYLYIRKVFVNFCYCNVSKIIVYGDAEIQQYSDCFPKLKDKFVFVQYGRDYFYEDKQSFYHNREYIASGGRSNRCYETLCKALDFSNTSKEYDCLVATRPECVTSGMEDSKVSFIYGITLNQFGSFIEGSKLFVLPLIDTTISAGHMAMMEAMSVRIPILITDIPAIRNYVDDQCVFFYKPYDAKDMADKIDYILNNIDSEEVHNKIENSFNLYKNNYSFNALLTRIVNISLKK